MVEQYKTTKIDKNIITIYMAYKKFVLSIILLLGIRYLYEKWKKKEDTEKSLVDYDIVRKHLLDETSLATTKKPILWIHITYEKNARAWNDFYSRTNNNLNQDYIYLTIKTIIEKCGDYFHVCLIDDNSIQKLLPLWNVNLQSTPNPLRDHLRKLGLSKILYNYGGLLVPSSFITFKCFQEYYKNLDDNKILIGEFVNRSNNSFKYYPNSRLLGCKKNSSIMKEYIKYLELLNSTNFNNSLDFENLMNTWFEKNLHSMEIISSENLGVKDTDDNVINIDRLIDNTYINLSHKAIGLYIPSDELLKRTSYNWFVYLTPNEVLNSNTAISKYLLLSL